MKVDINSKNLQTQLMHINSICNKLEQSPSGYAQIKAAELTDDEKTFIYVLLQEIKPEIEFELS